jgi:dihydrofolate reductase
MTIFKSIIAWCQNGGIGNKGGLPWTLKGDLARFARLTKGNGNNAVLMGRKTWESLPYKPLKSRHNIVLSSKLDYKHDNVSVFGNMEDAVNFCKDNSFDEVWIIGGAKVYDDACKALPLKEVYITEIFNNYLCDTFVSSSFVETLSKMQITSFEPFYEDEKRLVKLGNYVTYSSK